MVFLFLGTIIMNFFKELWKSKEYNKFAVPLMLMMILGSSVLIMLFLDILRF